MLTRRKVLTGALASAAAMVVPVVASAADAPPDVIVYSDMFSDAYRVHGRSVGMSLSARNYHTVALDAVRLSEKYGIPVCEIAFSDRAFLSLYQSGELSDFGPGHGWRLNRLHCPVRGPSPTLGIWTGKRFVPSPIWV